MRIKLIQDDRCNFIICFNDTPKTLGQCTETELNYMRVFAHRETTKDQLFSKILLHLSLAEFTWRKNNIASKQVTKDENGNFLIRPYSLNYFVSTGGIYSVSKIRSLMDYGRGLYHYNKKDAETANESMADEGMVLFLLMRSELLWREHVESERLAAEMRAAELRRAEEERRRKEAEIRELERGKYFDRVKIKTEPFLGSIARDGTVEWKGQDDLFHSAF